jgi:hypothetical protein
MQELPERPSRTGPYGDALQSLFVLLSMDLERARAEDARLGMRFANGSRH